MEEMKTQQEHTMLEQAEPSAEGAPEMTNGEPSHQVETLPTPKPAPPMDWRRFGLPVVLLSLLTVGIVFALQTMPRAAATKEQKTLQKIPTEISNWRLYEEYEMGDRALNELKPDEYLARIYISTDGHQADLSIIAGSHTGAFHNPQVCFRVQNWEFIDNREIELKPQGLNHSIKARAVQLVSLEGNRREAVGIYFYSTPMGYRSDTSSARILLLLGRLSGLPSKAYFVRFLMPTQGDAESERERLKQFAEEMLSAMAKTNPELVR